MSLVRQFPGCTVIDDGSQYDPTPYLDYCEYYRSAHRGKRGFWMGWRDALELCKKSGDDWFLFLQDDVTRIQTEEIKKICRSITGPYAFNIMRIGSDRGWTRVRWKSVTLAGTPCLEVSYVDCIFAANRQCLEKLDFTMHPIDLVRFANPYISSGVGQQLSRRMEKLNIPMYMPKKSLAYHGDHPSMMHPIERQRNPLVSV